MGARDGNGGIDGGEKTEREERRARRSRCGGGEVNAVRTGEEESREQVNEDRMCGMRGDTRGCFTLTSAS